MNLPTEVKAAIEAKAVRMAKNAQLIMEDVDLLLEQNAYRTFMQWGAEIYAEHLASGDLADLMIKEINEYDFLYSPILEKHLNDLAVSCAVVAQSHIDAKDAEIAALQEQVTDLENLLGHDHEEHQKWLAKQKETAVKEAVAALQQIISEQQALIQQLQVTQLK